MNLLSLCQEKICSPTNGTNEAGRDALYEQLQTETFRKSHVEFITVVALP